MTPAWLVLAGPAMAVVGYLSALVVHRAGRSTIVPLALVAAGLGLLHGAWLLAGVAFLTVLPLGIAGEDGPIVLIGVAAVPMIVVLLARRGARRMAGAFLAGTGLGWLLMWSEAVERVRDGGRGELLLQAAVPAGIAAIVIGTILVALRDPGADLRSAEVQVRRRKVGAFGAALMDRARLGPLSPSVLLTTATALIVSTDPTGTLDGWPAVGIAVAVAVIASELELRLAPARIRPALEAFHWVGRGESERFKGITGRTIPGTKGDAATWLATPPSEADLEYRSELLVWLERRPEALAIVAQMPERTAMERLQKALEADFIAWTADGRERGIDFDALVAAVEDPTERLRAEGLVAWRASQHRFAAGDPDWAAPLHAFRGHLGNAASGLHPGAMRGVVMLPALGIAVGLSALIQLWPAG